MASAFRSIACVIILLCLSGSSPRSVEAGSAGDNVPITYRINQKLTECIYENFAKSDLVTFSVFVIEAKNNGNPKATITFEGPISGNPNILKKFREATGGDHGEEEGRQEPEGGLGRRLKAGIQSHWPVVRDSDKKLRYDKRMGIIDRSVKVDWTLAGESEDAAAARDQHEAEKRNYYRNKGRGPPTEEDPIQTEKFRVKIMTKLEPFEETASVRAEGWYRLCVSSDYHALEVEMDLRSGRKMGGVDRATGHVYTWEQREMMDAEGEIDSLAEEKEKEKEADAKALEKEIENQVKNTDLSASKAQISHLKSMVMEMRKKHQDVNHRIRSHRATAERNFASLTRNNKIMTVLYILITGVQVYTVRKWLLGNSLLGN